MGKKVYMIFTREQRSYVSLNSIWFNYFQQSTLPLAVPCAVTYLPAILYSGRRVPTVLDVCDRPGEHHALLLPDRLGRIVSCFYLLVGVLLMDPAQGFK